jgi:hypothetical protein
LAVRLPVAAGLLVAFVDRTPFAGAGNVHALFDAELTAAARAYAAFSRRLFAIPFMSNSNSSARRLTRIDVVATVASAHRFEDAGAVAASGPRNAPIGARVGRKAREIGAGLVHIVARGPGRRHARVTHEAVDRGFAMHRRIAAAAVLHLVLTADGVFHRIRRAVFSADEALERGSAVARRFATAGNRRDDDTEHCTSQTKSIHSFSPGTGEPHTVFISNFGASVKAGDPK